MCFILFQQSFESEDVECIVYCSHKRNSCMRAIHMWYCVYIHVARVARNERQTSKIILKRRNRLRLSHTSSSVLFTSQLLLLFVLLLLLSTGDSVSYSMYICFFFFRFFFIVLLRIELEFRWNLFASIYSITTDISLVACKQNMYTHSLNKTSRKLIWQPLGKERAYTHILIPKQTSTIMLD